MDKQKYLLIDYLFLLAVGLFFSVLFENNDSFTAENKIILSSFSYISFYFFYYPNDRVNCILIFFAGILSTLLSPAIAIPTLIFFPVVLFIIHLRMKHIRILNYLKVHSTFKAAQNFNFREIAATDENISRFPGIKIKPFQQSSVNFEKEDFKYKMQVSSGKNSVYITLLDKEKQKYFYAEQHPAVLFKKKKLSFQQF